MLIVGERINSTRSSIHEAIKSRDVSLITNEAQRQSAAGAGFIDLNCAVTAGDELQDIDWALSVIQSAIKNVSICIDSPNFRAIERALNVYKGNGGLMINSITGEEERMKNILPLAVKFKTKLIALAMDDKGMPDTAEARLEAAGKIVARAKREGFSPENLYVDPLTRPIATEPAQAREFLKAIPMIKKLGVNTICGLSNISFGLPNRSLINSTFLSMAMFEGLDAAILDPLDKNMMASITASDALLGADEYCGEYIKAFREGRLK